MGKPQYAPIPARAMAAPELASLDLRVLAAIASHDRLGANGAGCFASRDRLAVLVDAHPNSVSRSIAVLEAQGFITVEKHPLNGRLRVYRVQYTDLDGAILKQGIGNRSATGKRSIGNDAATENEVIGNHDTPLSVTNSNGVPKEDQRDSSVNIFSETGIHSAEAGNTSRETKPGGGANGSVDAMLSMVERSIKAGSMRNGSMWHRYLKDTIDQLDASDPCHIRASRLLDTWQSGTAEVSP